MRKTCTKCQIEKDRSCFYTKKSAKDGLRSHCKLCMRASCQTERKIAYDKKRYEANKKRIDERAIRYYHENKEKKQEYDKKNLRKVLKKRRERYRTDLNYKLMCNLRGRLNQAIRRAKKCGRTLDLLGCTINELRQHIESKFIVGMSWKFVMTGEIHIDHIIPCSAFDMTDPSQQKKCFHYTNLQPLWAKDNFKKHTKIS